MNVPRWQLKQQAKLTISRSRGPYLKLIGILLGLLVLSYLLQSAFGGLMVMMPLSLEAFPLETGVWPVEAGLMGQLLAMGGMEFLSSTGGLVFALPMEEVGLVMVMLMPWSLLRSFIILQTVVLLGIAPFRMGALEQMNGLLVGRTPPTKALFRWYTDLKRLARAVVVQLVLGLWQWGSRLVCMIPGMALMVLSSQKGGSSLLLSLSSLLALAGTLAGYWLYCLLLPAQHILARRPELGPLQALREGAALFRGRRKELFRFRLSFLPWNMLSMFCANLPDAYLFAYEESATLLLLNAMERQPEPTMGQEAV